MTKDYDHTSPFEYKNILIELGQKCEKNGGASFLNAGRGNPNFFNTTVRDAFSFFHHFMALDATKNPEYKEIAFYNIKKGIAKRLIEYLTKNREEKGAQFLMNAISFAENEFNLLPDELIAALGSAVLGNFYPVPPRILKEVELIANQFLRKILYQDNNCPVDQNDFELFATEGATMSMVYLFNSLKENKLLNSGDHIAIGTPIFSPYLEIPALKDFELKQIHIKAEESSNWQLSKHEIDKLKDPKIKAFFLVNPSNPPGIALDQDSIAHLVKLVKEKRPDLIILTDTVYAPFVEEFRSLVYELPKNTICVYSYSKYFGVTGWRLGLIMLHKENIFNELIHKLPEKEKQELDRRYKTDSTDPRHLTFMERCVMDSRDIALAHTGGLSCPQQVMMALMSLYELMDSQCHYKHTLERLLKNRVELLETGLGMKLLSGKHYSHYYILVNILDLADKLGKKEAIEKISIRDFLHTLAEKYGVVALDGDGFGAKGHYLRISLANLESDSYLEIGKRINACIKQI
ncbi:MAG: bifunctional aspartate transaminase/aspartate 4-decarboxylase [Rhabdochlamydiaceae bacterium]|nr:bifunctional aspartate transaminase/aspartate 4-decarboxylase [Candidatus Amphrikana amoebophyrae]